MLANLDITIALKATRLTIRLFQALHNRNKLRIKQEKYQYLRIQYSAQKFGFVRKLGLALD